jgi:hypothetical protein
LLSRSNRERTEILYGEQNALNVSQTLCANAKSKINFIADAKRSSVYVSVNEYRNGIAQAKDRGVKIRFLTEITKDNIFYCKQIMQYVNELRHLEGVQSNVALSESEYNASVSLREERPLVQTIYSNIRAFVYQQQYIFETLWNKGVPAEQKIKEIEEEGVRGITRPHKTKIIENPEEVIKEIGRLTASSNKLDTCLTSGGLQYSHNYFFEIKKKLLERQQKGEHEGIRYITDIDSGNLQISKLYLDSGIQIRHMKNLPPMSFGVSDKEIAVTIEKMENGKKIQSLLISSEPLYVKHFTSLFEEIWRNGIDAAVQIRNIDEGHELANLMFFLILKNP